jgi:hypothetical protein
MDKSFYAPHNKIKSHLMTLVNLIFDLLEHLHQRSVCDPEQEIILDEVHQLNPVSPLEDCWDPENVGFELKTTGSNTSVNNIVYVKSFQIFKNPMLKLKNLKYINYSTYTCLILFGDYVTTETESQMW